MSSIFFGDSITEGQNSTSNFVDYLNSHGIKRCVNKGISGTTVGEYSIYPVDGLSLVSRYCCPEVKMADEIFLEYGINDVSAIMCGFTTPENVIISFVKAIDGIKQLNSFATINLLTIADSEHLIHVHAKRQCDYLSNDYFKGYDFSFPYNKCAELYKQLIKGFEKRVDNVIPMITDENFFTNYMSSDGVHPNEQGHELIGQQILKYM